MNHTTITTLLTTTGCLATTVLAAPPTWEDLPLGSAFATGDTTTSDGVDVNFDCFEWSSGGAFCGGEATVRGQIPGCNSGQRVQLNNINAVFDYAGSLGVQVDPIFTFGEYGGNINLAINGDFINFSDFVDIDGIPLGGSVVKILSGGNGSDCGRVQFVGTVETLLVGGQEFWWDGTPDCDIAFEDLTLGAVYPAVSNFVADGIPVTIRELIPPAGPPIAGDAIVGDAGYACGVGHELNIDNSRASFQFLAGPGPVNDLTMEFGEYGGFVNVSINGDLRVVANFKDLDGATVGGTTISIPTGGLGGDCGEMQVSGIINEFEVGGQELWIDCLRFEADPNGGSGGDECEHAYVDHSDLPSAGFWSPGDTLSTGGVDVTIRNFMSSVGPLFGNGLTSSSQLACGDDLELATYNTRATYDFVGSIGALANVTVLVSDQGGEVNLGINGVATWARDYADLDGTVYDGVTMTVESGGRDGDCTVLFLQGTVESLTLGGQQHFIDCIWAEDIMPATTKGDLNLDGCVNSADVGMMLGLWGTPAGDLNGDGTTDARDFGALLGNWGC